MDVGVTASAGMHLVANRSLFREPGNLWHRLSTSYNKRNVIIHRGENATEDEAVQAVAVARQGSHDAEGIRDKRHQHQKEDLNSRKNCGGGCEEPRVNLVAQPQHQSVSGQ